MPRKKVDTEDVLIPKTFDKVIWTRDCNDWLFARDVYYAQLKDTLLRLAVITTIEYGLLEVFIYGEATAPKSLAIARGDVPGTKKPGKFWSGLKD